VIVRDPAARFQFAALQSEAAAAVLRATTVATALPDSIILVDADRVFVRSDAALRILRRLRFPWPMFYGLMIVPRPIRDRVYDFIAAHRYRWFGRRERCMVPTADLKRRFLDS
jgi:predicted DCC family thiol-disulfide oxidoreductase YuxK